MTKKTLNVDLDGTLIFTYNKGLSGQILNESKLLPGVLETFEAWDRKGCNIILETGRRNSMRKQTERILQELGLYWDQLVMGVGGGPRYIINDRKPDGQDTAFAINLNRNEGIGSLIDL